MNQDTSAVALNEWLRKYPEQVQTGKSIGGMSAENQMNYLQQLFAENHIDLKEQYPNYRFTSKEVDVGFKPNPVNSKFILRPAAMMCRELF